MSDINKEQFCKDMYANNKDFKDFIDKNAGDSYVNHNVFNLLGFATSYEVAQYYHDIETGKESMNQMLL